MKTESEEHSKISRNICQIIRHHVTEYSIPHLLSLPPLIRDFQAISIVHCNVAAKTLSDQVVTADRKSLFQERLFVR